MMGADEAFQVTVADDGEDTKRVSGDQKIGLCQLNRILGEKLGVYRLKPILNIMLHIEAATHKFDQKNRMSRFNPNFSRNRNKD